MCGHVDYIKNGNVVIVVIMWNLFFRRGKTPKKPPRKAAKQTDPVQVSTQLYFNNN